LEARIVALRKEYELEGDEAETSSVEDASRERLMVENRKAMARSRQSDKVRDELVPMERRRR
jgi:hypothetical protein